MPRETELLKKRLFVSGTGQDRLRPGPLPDYPEGYDVKGETYTLVGFDTGSAVRPIYHLTTGLMDLPNERGLLPHYLVKGGPLLIQGETHREAEALNAHRKLLVKNYQEAFDALRDFYSVDALVENKYP